MPRTGVLKKVISRFFPGAWAVLRELHITVRLQEKVHLSVFREIKKIFYLACLISEVH